MIPKIIHYCWLSNDPIPERLQLCMSSWSKFLPDYKFLRWDFNQFDKASSLWVSEAYDNKKYAFAADYIRLYALYNYGGIYLDMDVEVLKPYTNEMLDLNTMICWEKDGSGLEVAAFGVEKNSSWVKKCLEYYADRHFVNPDGSFNTKVLPVLIKEILLNKQYNLVPVNSIKESLYVMTDKDIPVLSCDFFSPKSYVTGKVDITNNTYSIHHFAGSWLVGRKQYEHNLKEKLSFLPWRLGRILSLVISVVKYEDFPTLLKYIFEKIKTNFKKQHY